MYETMCENVLLEMREVFNSVTPEMIMSRATYNMSDEFDYPNEQDMRQAAIEIITKKMKSSFLISSRQENSFAVLFSERKV